MLERYSSGTAGIDVLPEGSTGVVSALVLVVGLAALLLGQEWFWVVFAVGYAAVVPVVAMFSKEDGPERASDYWTSGDEDTDDRSDPLETLRERYARGELTETQFERKLERLLETEALEDVADTSPDRADTTVAEATADERGRERQR